MKAAVTGSHGFVGRHLAAHLHDAGDDVAHLDVEGDRSVDITDRDAISERIAAARPDVLYHLAALTHVGESFDRADDVHRVNVDGTMNVLDACVAARVRRVIVVGSSEQYGIVGERADRIGEDTPLRPVSPYARSKAEAEERALEFGRAGQLDVICVRAFSHTGPGQSSRFLVPGLAARIVAAEQDAADEITIGNVEPVRDYSDVRDVVRAYRLLAERGRAGEVYNVCSGRGISVAELAHGLLALARRPLRLTVDPQLVRTSDVPVLVGDAARLRAATGWTPEIPLSRTLTDVLERARAG